MWEPNHPLHSVHTQSTLLGSTGAKSGGVGGKKNRAIQLSLRYCTLPNRPRGPSDLFFLSQRCLQASRRGGGTKGGNKIKELERDSGAEAKGATLIFFSFFSIYKFVFKGAPLMNG